MSDYSERLNEANKQLRFTNIKGKEYAEVNQRILAFWSLFPTGRIITKKTHDDGQRCEFECYVYREEEDEKPTTTGHAYEVKQGNVNSTSYVENCVPLDTRILTDEGWRYFYQVKPGDSVWSLNLRTGRNEFCKLTAVNVYKRRPLVRLSNSRFDFTCTPAHKWVTREQGKDGLGKTATEDLRRRQKIVTAVEQQVECSRVGRMLGWLMCDSELTFTADGMPSTAYISQAKHADDVSDLFGKGRAVAKRDESWKDCREWVVSADTVRDVLGRFGIASYADLASAMAAAPLADVAGCYRSMILADGEHHGFSSTHADLVEAMQIMCARLGVATNFITARMCKLSTKPIYTLGIKSTDGAYYSEMEVEALPPQDVWCPTTENGTWCARQRGFVTMTSNCETSAIGRALGLLGIGATTAIASADEVLNAIAQQEAMQSQPKPQKQQQGTSQPQRKKQPAKSKAAAPDAKKQAVAKVVDLKQKVILGGTSEEGVNSWYVAKFGNVGMMRLTDEQLKELTEYLEQIIKDQQQLKEAANVNQ